MTKTPKTSKTTAKWFVSFDARLNVATVTCGGRGFRYTLQHDATDIENIACIGEQLRHKALTGRYIDPLGSEEPITMYGRVFRVAAR